jgi:hypothetical protein
LFVLAADEVSLPVGALSRIVVPLVAVVVVTGGWGKLTGVNTVVEPVFGWARACMPKPEMFGALIGENDPCSSEERSPVMLDWNW